MSRTCLVLKGGGFSHEFLAACLREAMRMIRDQETQSEASGEIAAVCITNTERYQVLGDFGGILVEVRIESEARNTTLTMLVNPRFATRPLNAGTWDPVVLDGNCWRLANESPQWN